MEDENLYKIEQEMPSRRPMDLSPKELVLSLKKSQTVNTARERISSTGLSFRIDPLYSRSYQKYNYECLPVLRAFLDTYSTSSQKDTREDFLDALVDQLLSDSGQRFAMQFLCTRDEFRKHLLNSQLSGPISQRIECIRSLSKQLCVQPTTIQASAFDLLQYTSILTSLDQVIVELAYAAKSISKHKENHADTSVLVSDMVKDWCNELQKYRSKLCDKNKIITLNCPKDSSSGTIQAALNDRLLAELEPDKKKIGQEVDSTLQQARRQIESAKPLSLNDYRETRARLKAVLEKNKRQYLDAVMTYQIAPEFSFFDEEFPQVIVGLAQVWFENAKFITAGLERFLHGAILLVANVESSSSQTAKQLMTTSKQVVADFWEIMRQNHYAPKEPDFSFFQDIVDKAASTKQHFPYGEKKADIAKYLSDSLHMGPSVTDLGILECLYPIAITLEYFWTKHLERSIPVMMKNHQRYTIVLHEFES